MTNSSEIFGNKEFMRGIIAGVRYLLVRFVPRDENTVYLCYFFFTGKIELPDTRITHCARERGHPKESKGALVRFIIAGEDSQAFAGICGEPESIVAGQ